MIKDALSDWEDVRIQCEKYISVVAGQTSAIAKTYTPTTSDSSGTQDSGAQDSPPPYEVAVLPGYESLIGKTLTVDERAGRFRAMAKASVLNNLTVALSPPDMPLGTNRTQLNNAANAYSQISSILSGLYDDSTSDAARLASTITSSLIPVLSKVIDYYANFADGQKDPFSNGTTIDTMDSIIQQRYQQLKDGSDLAKDAETVFINFRTDSQGALNTLTRHVNELNQQLAAKEAALRDLQAQYDEWSWVIYWPIPPGLGAIIWLIIDSITETTSAITKLRNDINKLNSTQYYVTMTQNISEDVGNTTSSISRS